MFTRLPAKSAKVLMPESARATTVKGSGWTEKTARSFSTSGPETLTSTESQAVVASWIEPEGWPTV